MNKKSVTIIGLVFIVLAVAAFLAINYYAPAGKISAPAPAQTASTNGLQQQESAQQQEEVPTVEITIEKQQLIGVKTAVAEVKPLQKIIRTVGFVEYDERRLATVNTKFEGWIEKLDVDYSGRYVRKGEPMAEIYSPELLATQQEFLNLLKWKKESSSVKNRDVGSMLSKDAQAIIEGARQRLRLWDISDAQIDKIEQTGKPVRTLTI